MHNNVYPFAKKSRTRSGIRSKKNFPVQSNKNSSKIKIQPTLLMLRAAEKGYNDPGAHGLQEGRWLQRAHRNDTEKSACEA